MLDFFSFLSSQERPSSLMINILQKEKMRADKGGRKKKNHYFSPSKQKEGKKSIPNQQLTLNKLPGELQCRNFVTKHRLSIHGDAKTCKNMYAMRTYSYWASISHATVGGWVVASSFHQPTKKKIVFLASPKKCFFEQMRPNNRPWRKGFFSSKKKSVAHFS